MSIFEQIELEDKVMKICRALHENLCKDNQDPEDSLMSAGEVNQLEPTEALTHMTEAIKDLLSHERNLKTFRQHKSFHNSEAVQLTLQKLEADIREHVKIENQLKLYCENYKALIEEQENEIKTIESSTRKKLDELEAQNESLKIDLRLLEDELSKTKARRDCKDAEISREPESEIPSENDHKNVVLADKYSRIKKLKDMVKNKEMLCKELTRENKEMLDLIKKAEGEKDDIDFPTYSYYKAKYREKCAEALVLKKKLTRIDKNPAPKSQSPFLNTVRYSNSPLTKRTLNKKKSPVRSSSRSSRNIYRQRSYKNVNL